MKNPFGLLCRSLIIVVLTLPVSLAVEAEEYDGVIEPYMVVNVGGSTPGILATVDVDRGDFVVEGQVVATLESGVEQAMMEAARVRAEMEAAVKAKQARLDLCKRKKNREEELYEQEVLPFSQMDETETVMMLAQIELKEALENKRLAELEYRRTVEVLNRLTIRSKITGVVVDRFLSPGERIEDQPVLKLAQIHPLNVEVVLPVSRLPFVKMGTQARVIPEDPVGGQYAAEVKIVDKVIDAASGTFGVRLQLPNPDYRLPAGLKCKVIFLSE